MTARPAGAEKQPKEREKSAGPVERWSRPAEWHRLAAANAAGYLSSAAAVAETAGAQLVLHGDTRDRALRYVRQFMLILPDDYRHRLCAGREGRPRIAARR